MQEKKVWKGAKNPRTSFAKFDYLSEHIHKRERELGHFPTVEQLGMAARCAIQVYHGGYTNVKARMGKPLKWRYSEFSFKNWPMLKVELDEVIKSLGHFPSSEDLRRLHRNDMRGAIETIHGGFPAVRGKMGCGQVKHMGNSALSIWDNFKAEMQDMARKMGHFPAIKELRRIGRTDLTMAASMHHGGFVAARNKLGIVAPIKTGDSSLKHFDNIRRELLELEKRLGYFPTATDIQSIRQDISAAAQVHHGGYKKLVERLGKRPKEGKAKILPPMDAEKREIITNGLEGKPKDVKRLTDYYSPLLKRYAYGVDPKYQHELYMCAIDILESVRKGAGSPEKFAAGIWKAMKTGLSHEYMRLKTGYSIPTSDLLKLRFIHRHLAKFKEQHNRLATLAELEMATGYSGHKLTRLLNLRKPFSLDQPTSDGGAQTFADTVAERVQEKNDTKVLEDIEESKLDPVDKKLLIKKFGLDGNKPVPFGKLAVEHHMTRPGVKQRINDALARLKKD